MILAPSLLSFPANPEQQRLCQGRYCHELALRIPLDGLSSPSSTLAAGLARYADGRPLLSIHVKSSALSFSELSPVDSKETSRCRRISPSSRSIAPQIRSVL